MNPSSVLSPEIVDLGLAIGLLHRVGGSVEFDSDWFSNPGPKVATTLADGDRRAALVRFVQAVNGAAPTVNSGGVTLLKVIDASELDIPNPPDLSVMLAIDDRAATHVEVGLGVSFATHTAPRTRTDVIVPLYRTGKLAGQVVSTVPEHFALVAGAPIRVATSLDLAVAPDPSGFGLAAVEIAATVPVDGASPTVEITLRDLSLPGSTTPTTIHIGGPGTSLQESLLSLVLGVVRAAADALGNTGVEALAALDLVGLGPNPLLQPIDCGDLADRGVAALHEWFTATMADSARRVAWLGAVRDIIGGTVDPASGVLRIPLTTGLAITVGVTATPGSGGHLRVTPQIGVTLGSTLGAAPDAIVLQARATVDVFTIDVADGSLTPVPNAEIVVDIAGATKRLLSSGPLQIGAVHVGIGVVTDATGTDVVPVLRLLDVQTGTGSPHPVVDLSSANAAVAALGQVAGDLVRTALAALPAHVHLEPLLGLVATGSSSTVDDGRLLVDPLGALATWWRELLTDHMSDVPAVLAHVRDLIAHDSKAAFPGHVVAPIAGAGTAADPWVLPIVDRVSLDAWMEGRRLTVALSVGFRIDTLAGGCTVVETRARVELAIINLDATALGAQLLPAVDLAVSMRGRGLPEARLALGPVTVAADTLGLVARWTAASGLAVDLAAPNLHAEIDGVDVPLAFPVDGDWRTGVLDDLERLIGVLGESQPLGWLHDLLGLFGWTFGDDEHPHRLSLAELATNPSLALRNWADALATDADLIARSTNAVAKVLTGNSTALRGSLRGQGTDDDPWLVAFAGDNGPSLSVGLGPGGPVRPASFASSTITRWLPGLPGLPAEGLGQAILDEAVAGFDAAGMAAGRAHLPGSLADLVRRAVSTDGLAIAPPIAIAGVTVVTDGSRCAGQWSRISIEDALDGPPDPNAAIARIAVVSDSVALDRLPWPAVPPNRIIDLRAPGLTPESFTVATPAAGEWFVLLAPRADATLGVGDPSGVTGQAARLERVLRQLGTGRPVVVVALGGSGHAARLAADSVAAVSTLVTLGTPWSAIAFDTFRNGGSADAVRLLRSLLPAADPLDPDDADLATGRALVTAWLDGAEQFELDAPRPTVAVRAGLSVRAWFGALDQPTVERALTAVAAAGLSARAVARSALAFAAPQAAHVGVHVPLPTRSTASGHGIAVSGGLDLGLAARTLRGSVAVATPRLKLRLDLADTDGWLIGGPGTTPPASSPPLELRRMSLLVDLGLGASDHRARLVLHDVSALGAFRDIVVIEPGVAAIDTVPFLPEARAVMNALMVRLAASDAGSAAQSLLAGFIGVGLATPQGLIPDGLNHLLHDPSGFVHDAVSAATSRNSIADALVALLPGTTRSGDRVTLTDGALSATFDLSTRRAECVVSGHGALPWRIALHDVGAPHPTASMIVGDASANAFAVRAEFAPGTSAPLTVAVDTRAPNGSADEHVALWPVADSDALIDLARSAIPAEATRLVLEGLRGLDPIVGSALDALAAALGVLTPVDPQGQRRIAAPLGLFRDPGAWLRNHALGSGTSIDVDAAIDLFEAVKPFIGMPTAARGTWPVVPGVVLHVSNGAGGARLGCDVDPTVWLGGADRLPFAAGFELALTIPASGNPRPTVEVFAGAPDASGRHRQAVHVVLDGTDLRVFLRNGSGDDLALYPNPAGIKSLVGGGAELLLPKALNALAGMSGDPVRTQVAELVSAFGRGLGVTNVPVTTPAVFDGQKLHELALHPADRLAAQAFTLLAETVAALNPLLGRLPGTASALMSSGSLIVTVHGVVLTVQPTPLRIAIGGSVSGLPIVGTVAASFKADATGLTDWGFGVGPARFVLGGPVIRPLVRGARTPTGWELALGLALDDIAPTTVNHKELFGRWRSAGGLDLVARTRGATTDTDVTAATDAGRVALFAADAVLELLGNWIIELTDVSAMLDRTVNGHTVRSLLVGSLLSGVDDHKLAAAPVSNVPTNLFALTRKVAGALPVLPLGPVSLGLHLDGDLIGVRLEVTDHDKGLVLNAGSSPEISIVTKATWIEPPSGTPPDPGIVIDLVSIPAAGSPITLKPAFAVNGVGLRIGSANGPLLDSGLRIDAVQVHLFGKLAPDGSTVAVSGGVHVEIDGLAVPLGPGGGDNAVAKGVLADAGGSGGPPTPKFSPALAVQAHHGGNGVAVTFAAGDGDGPWYLPIQKAFGPLYLEQIGLGATHTGTPRHLDAISLSLDGSVALFGITASVDKLRLTYQVTKPFFDLHSWTVDLDGFAISSSIGGLTLAGALLKTKLTGAQTGYDYLGMLKIGFNGYGVDLFGGYSNPNDGNGTYASFFAFGALHAPLGGPPAFFITGIGIGFGINRELKAPTMETITSNPFLVAMKALGPAPDPKAQLLQMQANISPRRGEYWIAAGISFTSFVLISGEIVLTVAFGDGLEITLLGLARAELPTPILKLVSIELALLARFSSKEGTLLVQAQLTENSWLLTESVRLTGGFAFATWWKGPNAGQFVVTMGGYHPKFHHDGYPTVPRLGFRWQPIDNVSVIGESYFALCSEALMAGTRFEAHAHFGPAYARVSFGADGIVYFDPFWFDLSAYAEIAAGIKLWLLFGTVTIELSLSANVRVTGPPIHVEGRFEICGFEVPFEFGTKTNPADKALSNSEFRDKYLRASADAQVLQATVLRGSVAAGKKSDGSPAKVPDGSAANPFQVVPEFEVVFISTAPAIDMQLFRKNDTTLPLHVGAPGVGVAPMMSHTLTSDLKVEVLKLVDANFSIAKVKVVERALASFPKGVWGEAQDRQAKSVPKGETVNAADGFTMSTKLDDPAPSPQIDYHQVEIRIDRKRKPLPFVVGVDKTNSRRTAAAALVTVAHSLEAVGTTTEARFATAAKVLGRGGYGAVGVAALRGERSAVPLLGSLADDLVKAPNPVSRTVTPTPVNPTANGVIVDPMVMSLMGPELSVSLPTIARTTVAEPGTAVARTVPSIEGERVAMLSLAPAALVVSAPRSVAFESATTLSVGAAPVTRLASSKIAAVANASPDHSSRERLRRLDDGLRGDGLVLHDGEVIVVSVGTRALGERPNQIEVSGGATRVVCLASGGNVLSDDLPTSGESGAGSRDFVVDVPSKCERVVLAGVGASTRVGGTLDGWYRGQSLPLIGWDMVLGAASIVRFESHKAKHNAQRANGGWANTRELTSAALVATRFDHLVTAIAVAVDDLGGRDAASSIEMRLVGAVRANAADGSSLAPTVLVDGLRSILVYEITPVEVPGAFDPNVTVIVENCRDGQLAGVAATTAGRSALIVAISAAGFDAAIASAVPSGPLSRRVIWSSANPNGPRRVSPSKPAKKAAPPKGKVRVLRGGQTDA